MTLAETATVSPERIVVQREGETVWLQQLVADDAESYYDLIAYDPDHLRQHGDTTADKYPDVGAVRRGIEQPSNPDRYRFGIWDGDTMVGSNNVTRRTETTAELGSWVGKQYAGQAYASRGRALLVDFAFDTLGLDQVYCDITVGNEASRRSVEKSGFEFAGEVVSDDGKRYWRYTHSRQGGSDGQTER